uniref:Secreted protein n=1 Tax=Zea mays TaxID=4577 RepID=C0HJ44_MAIZE|nr:unknown [Zea mays]
MVWHLAPCVCSLFVQGLLVPTDRHQEYLSTCLAFCQWISQSLRRLITHVPWIFRAAASSPEALHIVRPEPVHHGAPVTATEPVAAWWILGNKSVGCRIGSIIPSALPAALP